MSNRRKIRGQKPPGAWMDEATALNDPTAGGSSYQSVDYIEHADDCEGLMEYLRIEERDQVYEVYDCTRCGEVWFIVDGDEVSRGGPPESKKNG